MYLEAERVNQKFDDLSNEMGNMWGYKCSHLRLFAVELQGYCSTMAAAFD